MATPPKPTSGAARKTRIAISPRLAHRIRLNGVMLIGPGTSTILLPARRGHFDGNPRRFPNPPAMSSGEQARLRAPRFYPPALTTAGHRLRYVCRLQGAA